MKAFIFWTTTEERWEICGSSYLVLAESKEEAESIFDSKEEKIVKIEEVDLSVKGQIEIQESRVE